MTPAEKIAVGLLGWKPKEKRLPQTPTSACYEHPKADADVYILAESGRAWSYIAQAEEMWPGDLSDWNTIRRIEDAIAERGLFDEYIEILRAESPTGHYTRWVKRATTKHCIAAALRVLDERVGGR